MGQALKAVWFVYADGQSESIVTDIENMVRSYIEKVLFNIGFAHIRDLISGSPILRCQLDTVSQLLGSILEYWFSCAELLYPIFLFKTCGFCSEEYT